MALTKRDILAALAGWFVLASNLVRGLGVGHLRWRRLKACWYCICSSYETVCLGAVLESGTEGCEEGQAQ